jgi:hypothetical protein
MTIQKAVSKKGGVTPMSFRLPTETVDAARAHAAAAGITLTWFLIQAMEAAIQRDTTTTRRINLKSKKGGRK